MRILTSAAALLAFFAAVDAPVAHADTKASDAAAANDFTFDMYKQLDGASGNVFFSGTSMREALGIAYLGARGATSSEMSTALHLDANHDASAAAAKAEIAGWNAARGGAELSIANRLWVDGSFGLVPAFASASRDAYGASAQPIDFRHAPDPSRLVINGWVSQSTHDRIKDLLPANSVDSDTSLVITNAVYFKGQWKTAFDKNATRDDAFLVDGKTQTKAPTMHQTAAYSYGAVPGAHVLEMKYGKSDLAMDIVLPDDATGLSKLESSLGSGTFATWTSSLHEQEVDLSLPKVQFTWGKKMNEPLKAMGMKTAFDGRKADFTGIASPAGVGGNLYVSDVFHKAFVAIDEQGTEAAAATGVVIARETAVMFHPSFRVDHPFLFAIRDVKSGRVLFMGRVTDPRG